MTIVFNYGGGRQTVAMCIMIAKGILPKPDVAVMADTGRENPMTWEYLDKYTQPLMRDLGVPVQVASHELATVDLHGHNGDLLIPVYTQTGKLPTYCSNEWKRRVVNRYLRSIGVKGGGVRWIGLAMDERKRWKRHHNVVEGNWKTVCPLVDKMMNTHACLEVVKAFGWPEPHHSSCWMCPHKRNKEWRDLRDKHPEAFQKAIDMDEELRDEDEMGGVFLHNSRVPLAEADIERDEDEETVRQCSLGMCFV